jgi:hypothetical protein
VVSIELQFINTKKVRCIHVFRRVKFSRKEIDEGKKEILRDLQEQLKMKKERIFKK